MSWSGSEVRREAPLRAHRVCRQAVERTFDDLVSLTDQVLHAQDHRLVVFRCEPGPDQPRLTAVDFASAQEAHTLGAAAADRAALTELHGDLITTISRYAGERCPSGIVVAIDQRMIVGCPETHCAHWNGQPTFLLALEGDDLLAPPKPEPCCCPAHLVPALLERYDLALPTRRTHHDCDGG